MDDITDLRQLINNLNAKGSNLKARRANIDDLVTDDLHQLSDIYQSLSDV